MSVAGKAAPVRRSRCAPLHHLYLNRPAAGELEMQSGQPKDAEVVQAGN